MAITHTQLIDMFGFESVKTSAYGIKAYKKFKSGIELFAKKNKLEIIVPGLPVENYNLEHISTTELKEKLPKLVDSIKKKAKASMPEVKDIFLHKVFLATFVNEETAEKHEWKG